MELESYLWAGQHDHAIPAGQAFLENYGTFLEYRKEIATALLTLSRIAKERHRYAECIVFAKAVFELYPTEDFIWPGMDHVQRGFYDLTEALYSSGDFIHADDTLSSFRRRFPESDYIKAIEANRAAGIYEQHYRRYGATR